VKCIPSLLRVKEKDKKESRVQLGCSDFAFTLEMEAMRAFENVRKNLPHYTVDNLGRFGRVQWQNFKTLHHLIVEGFWIMKSLR
jgi:hypothetical protein